MPGSQHWNTPPEIVDRAHAVLGGIDLDPFCNPAAETRAYHQLDVDDDGFSTSWKGNGSAFVNGPWNRTKDVVRKCVQEWLDHQLEIIAVIPASLNASYWCDVERAPAVCRPFRRVSFLRDGEPVKGNRQDCVIVYWGFDIYRFRAIFSDIGEVRFG